MAKRSRSRSRSRDRSKSQKRKRHRSESKIGKKKHGTHKNSRKHSTEKKTHISRKHNKETNRRRRNSSSTSSTSSSSSSSSRERRRKERKKKKHKKKEKKRRKEKERHIGPAVMAGPSTSGMQADEKPVDPKANAMRPMTKAEWDKKQNVIRKVYDPETGRERLVKGSGEILEEIVSKDRQREINKQATRGDGLHYATQLGIQDK